MVGWLVKILQPGVGRCGGDLRGVDWDAWTVDGEGELLAWPGICGDMLGCKGGDRDGMRLGGSYRWWHYYKTGGGVGSAIELAEVCGREQVIYSESPLIYSQRQVFFNGSIKDYIE